MADINVTEEIIDINVTEEVVNIIAPLGGYPLPNTINSVFGRVGNIVATEGDYTLTQLGDVTLTSPSNGQVLKYNGTTWVNSTDADTGITTLNTLTALSQTFATGTSGTDFNISSATSTHTFNIPTASATNRGLLSSTDWTTFNSKQNALTNPVTGTGTTNTLPKFTAASTIGNSNVSDSGTLISLGVDTLISGFTAGSFTKVLPAGNTFGGLANGATGTFSGSANGWAIISRQTWNINDDAFTFGGHTANDTRIIINRSATSANGYGAFQGVLTNNGSASQFGTIISALTSNGSTGNFAEITIYKAGQNGPYTNTNSYTSYYAFRAQFNPQNITNYYGLEISDVTPTTLARALNLNMAAGTNKFNIYAGGTANNFLSGDTGIGTATLGTATQLTIGGTETAVSAISRGQLINTTLVASANSDALVALDIAPTYTLGAFTSVAPVGLRLQQGIASAEPLRINMVASPTSAGALVVRNSSNTIIYRVDVSGNFVAGLYYDSSNQNNYVGFVGNGFNVNFGGNIYSRYFPTTGNLTLQNGGTFTDAGFRLDVNGTTRFIGTASSDTAPLGAELAAVTGTGTNWTLAGTNLNVGGYTHTTGSVDPLTTALAAVNFTYYQIAYTITGRTTGSITINYGGTSTSGITATGNTGPLASSTAVLTITPTTDFNGTVVLSIRSISTSSASSTFANSASTSNIEVRASNITSNTFIGLSNGRRNTTGANNTFIGQFTGISNTTGAGNTIIGAFAGQSNTIAFDNTFVGTNTGANNTASLNTFLGANAGAFNTTGISNTFVGRAAGQSNTTGSSNVMFGQNAGRFITGGSTANTISNNSIFIGDNTRAGADGQNNQIVIGTGTTGLGTNTTIIGTTSTTITGLYGNIRLVSGMGTAPASSTATGTTGDIVVTAGFIYVCTATNTWVRTALTTW